MFREMSFKRAMDEKERESEWEASAQITDRTFRLLLK